MAAFFVIPSILFLVLCATIGHAETILAILESTLEVEKFLALVTFVVRNWEETHLIAIQADVAKSWVSQEVLLKLSKVPL